MPSAKAIGPLEIIEIGAVAWRGPGEAEREEFQAFVRPEESPVLSDFCRTLTTIQQNDVDAAQPLAIEIQRFLHWCAGLGAYRLVSWGAYDCKQIRDECTRKGIPPAQH